MDNATSSELSQINADINRSRFGGFIEWLYTISVTAGIISIICLWVSYSENQKALHRKELADKLLKLHPELKESYDIYFIDGRFTYYEVDMMVKELGR